MATAATIKKNIAKLEAALKSKATPKSLKSKLETQLVKSKAELSGINKGSKPKTSTSKSAQTALQKLKEMVNKNKKLKTYKKSGVDLEKDADRPALPIGRRTAKASGKTYYEYRANRIDVKQPPKRYPKLEKGGRVDDFSDKIQEGDIVWDSGNNSYGVVLNTYDFKYGEIRLDSDGNQPEENLHKLGSKGDKGTKEKLKAALLAHKSLITKYPEMGYEKVNYAKGGMSQGYDDREDERLGMKYGKIGSKDLDSTHARRDDARFEERGKMAKGGMFEKPIPAVMDKFGNIKSEKILQQDLEYLKEAYEDKLVTKAEYDKSYDEIKEQLKLLQKKEKGGYMADGGKTKVDRERMYNFLKDDLAALEKAIEANNQEEIDKFFSYWSYHLSSLEPKTGSKRMYEFLKDDLVGLEAATKELPSSKEETDRFFSYWNTHLSSLEPKKMAKGGYFAKGGAVEHGLKRGDTIIDDMSWDNSVKVLNNKTGYAVVHLETGERKEMKAMGGEIHRTQE